MAIRRRPTKSTAPTLASDVAVKDTITAEGKKFRVAWVYAPTKDGSIQIDVVSSGDLYRSVLVPADTTLDVERFSQVQEST